MWILKDNPIKIPKIIIQVEALSNKIWNMEKIAKLLCLIKNTKLINNLNFILIKSLVSVPIQIGHLDHRKE